MKTLSTKSSNQDLPGLLMLIDFQKALDTVEWDFLFETLKAYQFGPIFISWINAWIIY